MQTNQPSYQNSYCLPPEWAPQSGVMLTWPHAQSDWAPWLTAVEAVFINIAAAITAYEKVIISCFNTAHQNHIATQLSSANISMAQVCLYVAPSNDTWVRDHGPITVLTKQQPRLLNFTFNAWGGKYQAEQDNQLTPLLHQQGAFGATPMESSELILEGGSIEVDGAGTLLTTSRCLLANTRNHELSREQLEHYLKPLLGVSQVLWLENGYLAGDDTDSHIDTLARFTNSNTICYMACDDPNDPHYHPLQAMAAELANFKNLQGQAYNLVPLPWPAGKYNKNGERLPATYANFLIINNAVLVPTYNDPADSVALVRLQACFPNRKIIAIPCSTLIEQYGSLHCVTMQLPQGVF